MSLQSSVLKTLSYSDYFSFPLTFTELYYRLIQVKTTSAVLKLTLKELVDKKIISKSGDYYYLPGRENIIRLRKSRQELSRPLLHRARVLASQLFVLPGVLAFYLTGSLAVQNIDKDADLDLLVISFPGSLWSTRLVLTLVTTFLGLRRTPGGISHYGKLCLNLYLTPDSLTVPESRRSLYTAYELIQTIPLYDPHGTHQYLLSSNTWINDYLPNYALPTSLPTEKLKTPFWAYLTEWISYSIQLFYMRSRLTRELVTKDSAYFHPSNPGKKVLSKLGLK